MKQRVLRGMINVLFVGMIAVAFLCAQWATEEPERDITKEDFTILQPDAEISALYYDGTNVWVGTSNGVFAYDATTLEVVRSVTDLKLIYSAGIVVTESPEPTLWVGHEKGLTQIATDGQRTDYTYPDLPKGRVNAVSFDQNTQTLWCGTYNGAATLQRNTDAKLDAQSEGKTSVKPDAETGTNTDATASTWQVTAKLTAEHGLCSNSANTFLPLEQGMLIGSYLDHQSGGLTLIKTDGTMQTIGTADGLPHPYVTSLLQLPNEDILVGTGYMTDGGLAILAQENGQYRIREVLDKTDGLPGEKIRSLFYSDSHLWITTEYDGVLIISLQDFAQRNFANGRYLRQENGLSDNEIKCIAETQTHYWLGGKYGLTLIEKSYLNRRHQID